MLKYGQLILFGRLRPFLLKFNINKLGDNDLIPIFCCYVVLSSNNVTRVLFVGNLFEKKFFEPNLTKLYLIDQKKSQRCQQVTQ